jgi:hypothetical protein
VIHLRADRSASCEQIVAKLYRTTAATLTHEPRVAAAMLSDVLGNPRWLVAQVHGGRIRDIPAPLLMQMLMGPLLAQVLMRLASRRKWMWIKPARRSCPPSCVPSPDIQHRVEGG